MVVINIYGFCNYIYLVKHYTTNYESLCSNIRLALSVEKYIAYKIAFGIPSIRLGGSPPILCPTTS